MMVKRDDDPVATRKQDDGPDLKELQVTDDDRDIEKDTRGWFKPDEKPLDETI